MSSIFRNTIFRRAASAFLSLVVGLGPTASVLAQSAQYRIPLQLAVSENISLEFNPDPVNFEEVAVGQVRTIEARLSNRGGSDAQGITMTARYPFSVDGSACRYLPAGGDCPVWVSFAPGSPGSVADALSIRAGETLLDPVLVGNGVALIADLDVSDGGGWNFGLHVLGTVSPSKTLTLNNVGTGPLSLAHVGPLKGSEEYKLVHDCPAVLAAGASCSVTVQFEPETLGQRLGAFRIKAVDGSVRDVWLLGYGILEGQVPELPLGHLSALSEVNFGGLTLPAEERVQTLSLANTGSTPLNLSELTLSGEGAGAFSLRSECPAQLAPYSACAVHLGFQPSELASYTASVDFTVAVHEAPVEGQDTGIQPVQSKRILLKGSGTQVPTELAANPESINFGSTKMNIPVRRTVTLTNHSEEGQSLRVSYATNAENFVVLGGCSGVIAAGESCELELLYQAATPNLSQGELILVSRETNQTIEIPLVGAAPMPDLTIRPLTLRFGTTNVEVESPARKVSLVNTGLAAAQISSIALTRASSEFLIDAFACGAEVPARSQCDVLVRFKPYASGERENTLRIQTDDAENPVVDVELVGVGQIGALTVNPTSAYFSSQEINTSESRTFSVTNRGPGTVRLTRLSITGSGASAYKQTQTCSDLLQVGASCEMTVTFTPNRVGSLPATLNLYTGDGLSRQVNLSGWGHLPKVGVLDIFPSPVEMGQVSIYRPAVRTIQLKNTGTASLEVQALSLSGPDVERFSLSHSCEGIMAVGKTCMVTLTGHVDEMREHLASVQVQVKDQGTTSVQITALGAELDSDAQLTVTPSFVDFGTVLSDVPYEFDLTLSSTGAIATTVLAPELPAGVTLLSGCQGVMAPGETCDMQLQLKSLDSLDARLVLRTEQGQRVPVALRATVPVPVLEMTPESLHFPATIQGQTSDAQAVRVVNTGTAALRLGEPRILGAAQYEYIPASACPASIAPGQSCEIVVRFSPLAEGVREGILYFTSNDRKNPSVRIDLTGVGLPDPTKYPGLTVSPSSLNFESTLPGAASAARTITLTNTGGALLSFEGIGVVPAGSFSSSNNCGEVLAPEQSCQVVVQFTPSVHSAATSNLTILSDALNAAVRNVPLRGAGPVVPTLRVSPSPVDLGVGAVDEVRSVTVSLHNEGEEPTVISRVTIEGEDDGHFTVETSQCRGALAVSVSCLMTVNFTPSRAGRHEAQLQIEPTAGESLFVPVVGSGPAAQATLSPASLIFGEQSVGFASDAQEVVLTNSGTVPLRVGALSWGNYPSAFTVSRDCPVTLPVGESCVLEISAKPLEVGLQEDALTIASGHTAGILAVPVQVQGVAPSASVLPTVLELGTVYQGASVQRSVQILNTGDVPLFVKNVSFETNPAAAGYSQTNTCANGVQPGESCDVLVRLAPVKEGNLNNALRIDTASGLFTVPIVAMGSRLAIHGVTPTQVPTAGGVQVTVTGAGFTADTHVQVGDAPATDIAWVSSTQLLVTVPPQPAGFTDVVLTQEGANPVTGANALEFIEAPVITGLTPNEGSIAGGWSAELSGEHFISGMRVFVDGQVAALSNRTQTSVTLRIPARAQVLAGPVDVVVVTPGGEVVLFDGLNYTIPPANLVFEGATGAFDDISQHAFYERTFTLRNAGDSGVVLSALAVESADGVFTLGEGTCPTTFPIVFEKGATCTVTVIAHSTSLGEKSAQLVVTTSAPVGAFELPLSASVIEPDYSLSGTPGTMTLASGRFGVVAALSEEGGTNGTLAKTIYLNNSFGVAGTRIRDVEVTIAGQQVEAFTIESVRAASNAGGLRDAGTFIAPDGRSASGSLVDDGDGTHPHLAVTLRYAPAELGDHDTQLTIRFNGDRVVGLPLHGQAQFINEVSLLGDGDFGINGFSAHPQTLQSTSKTYTLRSDPAVGKRLKVDAIRIQGEDAGSFVVTAYDKHRDGEPLNMPTVTPVAMVQGAALEDLRFTVRFTPTRLGEHQAQLVVESNSDGLSLALDLSGVGARDVVVALSEGAGTTPITDYPMTGIGSAVVKDVFLRNVGSAGAVAFTGIQIVGSPAFTLADYGRAEDVSKTTIAHPPAAARYMTQPVYGTDVAKGGATDFFSSIRFNPSYVGMHEAQVTIWHDAPGESTTFTLRGEAVRAAAVLSADSTLPVVEPDGDIGMASFNGEGHASNQVLTKTFHVMNATAIGQLRVTRLQVIGEQAGAFAITRYEGMLEGAQPSRDVRPSNMRQAHSSQALSFTVSFTPTQLGAHSAQLLVEHDGMNSSPLVMDLMGFGERDIVFAVSQGGGIVPLEPINGTALETPVTRTLFLRNVGTAGLARYLGFSLEGSNVFAVKAVGLVGRNATTFTPSVTYPQSVREGTFALEGADVRLAPSAQTDLAITVEMTPRARDTFAGQLTIHHDGTPEGQTVIDLVAGFYAPDLVFYSSLDDSSPIEGIDFGRVPVPTESESFYLKARNEGNHPFNWKEAVLPVYFELRNSECGNSLDIEETCNMEIVFKPTSAYVRTNPEEMVVFSKENTTSSLTLKGEGFLVPYIAVSVGGNFRLGLKEDGSVWGQGNNQFRNLGDFDEPHAYQPVEIAPGERFTRVVTSKLSAQSAFLKDDGTWWVSGSNSVYGALGYGPSVSTVFLRKQPHLEGVVEVIFGENNTFARTREGSWLVTGQNHQGQLGLGHKSVVTSFTYAPLLDGVVKVVPGASFTYFGYADGTWKVVGYNGEGQLGTNSTGAKAVPSVNDFLQGVRDVQAGKGFVYIQKADGSWWATGQNNYGQLGLGDFSRRLSFTRVTGLPLDSQVYVGDNVVMAKTPNGEWLLAGQTSFAFGIRIRNSSVFLDVSSSLNSFDDASVGGIVFATFKRADGSWNMQ